LPNDRVLHIAIRAAEMNDAAAFAQLMCELGYQTSTAEMRQRLEWILTDARYRTFIAELDNQIAGMIGTLTLRSYEHNDAGGRILTLVIFNRARRRGIGRALIVAAEKDFAQRGVRRVAVDTRLTRKDAHKFYEALGYERNGWRFMKQLSMCD